MLKKDDITQLCKKIAEDYDGWEFVANAFKDKRLAHTIKLINPLWTFSYGSVKSQPLAAIYNKKINKIYKKVHSETYWTHSIRYSEFYNNYPIMITIYDITEDQAECRIRSFMDQGLEILEKSYDFSSEQALLESIPFNNEKKEGVMKCITQCHLGNHDFVKQYYNEEIETQYPKRLEHVKKVMDYFEIENSSL